MFGDSFYWLDRFQLSGADVFRAAAAGMTMALFWKTKQVILDSVFGARH